MAVKKKTPTRRASKSVRGDDEDMRGSFFTFNIGHVLTIVSMAVAATLFVSQINTANQRLDDMKQAQLESRSNGLLWQNEQRGAIATMNGLITDIRVQLAGKVDKAK